MSIEERVTEEVRALERLDLEGLRAEWRRRYGPPPTLRSKPLLAHMLAWRIQAAAFGGLEPDLTRRLRRGAGIRAARSQLPAGMKLSREWSGEVHEIEVLPDGFRYRGESYKSQSSVAGLITGTKWNGRRFFGLDKEGDA